jgi:hypothetical protein
MSINASMISDFLRQHVTSGARVYPGRIPDTPNRIISVQMIAGAGPQMDGLFDTAAFVVTCRGAENNFPDAEAISKEVDDIFMGIYPDAKTMSFFMAEDVYVDVMGRTGGGPIQLPMTDSLSRFTFTCNYYAQVATGIGQVANG